MAKKSKHWKINKRTFDFGKIEAICDHGIGHHKGIHGCDGCCASAPKEIWDQVTDDSQDMEPADVMMESIDTAITSRFDLCEQATKKLLARHNFRSEHDARENGYELVMSAVFTGGESVMLCKVVDQETIPAVTIKECNS